VRAALASLFALIALAAPVPALALEWPDTADKVERDLSSDDVPTRLAAARRLDSLGPARGGPLALAALDDADDDVRAAAADAAIRLRTPGATERVSSWVGAPDARLRRKACEVAGAMPSAGATTVLARALGDPEVEVREAAARALGRQGSPDAVTPLLGRLDDTNPEVRVAVAGALAQLHDSRAVVPLVGKIGDSSAEVRRAVARALGELGDTRASSRLVTTLRDGNIEVRREALGALGLLRATDAVDAIVSFSADRTPAIRLAALHALAEISTPESISQLVAALGGVDEAAAGLDSTPVRDALVWVGPAAIPGLRDALTGSKSRAAAAGAAWVLGALGAHAEAPAIVAAMRSGAIPVAFAMRALAGAGTAAEAPVVLEFVIDPNPVVRDEALRAAMALLDPTHPDGRAVEPLAAALDDTRLSVQERSRVALLLGRTGAARAAPLLAPWVHAGNPELRLAAIDALGALGPAQADDTLLQELRSEDPKMRLHAAIALSDSGGARALVAVLAELGADTEVDRAALLTAAGGILARLANAGAVEKLEASLRLSVGPERDAFIEAIGRAPIAAAVAALERAIRSQEPFDRRAAASMLSAHPRDAPALALARSLLGDADASVRSQAAWSLGTIGDTSDLARLEPLTSASDVEVAVDSIAAIGRIAAREHASAAQWLCPILAHGSAFARINALAGLANGQTRCPRGELERKQLVEDPDEEVRGAAARTVASLASPPDTHDRHDPNDAAALDRCARSDASAAVAARCRARSTAPAETGPLLVYVVPDGSNEPRPDAFYGIIWADGWLRLGRADRRGAFFDPVAPKGTARLVNVAGAQADP
jgi:HEAT repeat protein